VRVSPHGLLLLLLLLLLVVVLVNTLLTQGIHAHILSSPGDPYPV